MTRRNLNPLTRSAPAWRDRLPSMSLASRIKPQILAADAPSLMISCGLALRGFDA